MQCTAVVHARAHRARGRDWLWYAYLVLDNSLTQESARISRCDAGERRYVLLRTCPHTGLTRRLLKRCSTLLSVVEICLGDCAA